MNIKKTLASLPKRTLLLALIGSVLLLTIIINVSLKGLRLDLTQDNLYTLSDGTYNILDKLESPVTLKFFYSDKLTKDIPPLRNYAKRVQELLEEYVLAANGNLTLEIIDPEPFSENEDKAAELGLQAVPISAGGPEIYFGLAGINNKSPRTSVIEFFHANKEETLEYDVTQLIYKASQNTQPKLGLISSLDLQGGYNPMTRQPTPAWMSYTQITQSMEIKDLGNEPESIESDITTLLLIHPKELSKKTQYAIDQFALRGGNILVFVDPVAESESQMPVPGLNVNGASSSDLELLFPAWGIEFKKDKVLADSQHAIQVGVGANRPPVRHLAIQNFGQQNFDRTDSIIKKLENINVSSSGVLNPAKNASTQFTSLIQSSDSAMLIDAAKITGLTDPSALFQGFAPTGEKYTVAARVTGHINTAFPDGAPKPEKSDNKDGKDKKNKESKKAKPAHLNKSTQDINIFVFADTDVLSNRLWVRVQQFFGQQLASPFADNGTLLFNAVDQLMGNADLISIRSRGRHQIPFDKVNELKRQAEFNYRKTEEELRARLQETEQRLQALQTKKEGADKLKLSDEQKSEIEKFQKEKLQIRKKLREVQHQLGEDINKLGSHLKLINIALIPLLLTILVLGLKYYRRRQRA